MLLAIDLHKDFIDVEGVAVASVLALQAAGIYGTELDTPETDLFPGDGDISFRQEIFDVSVARIEAIVQPNCVADDIWRESVTFVRIHQSILAILAS